MAFALFGAWYAIPWRQRSRRAGTTKEFNVFWQGRATLEVFSAAWAVSAGSGGRVASWVLCPFSQLRARLLTAFGIIATRLCDVFHGWQFCRATGSLESEADVWGALVLRAC